MSEKIVLCGNQPAGPEIVARAAELLAQMTLSEKIAQMTQVEKGSITPADVAHYGIGSVLSGGGGNPQPNSPATWREMVNGFIAASLESRLKIPLIYGSDAVHGHNNVRGATIFPHNNGLGATGDADLVERIARATGRELAATGVRWNFAPAVSLPLDIRWGRSYEGFSQDSRVITEMAAAYVRGLVGDDPICSTLPSVKHYIGDGSTTWGTSTRIQPEDINAAMNDPTLANANLGEDMVRLISLGAWRIDQGQSGIGEAELRAHHLPPYIAAMEAGALNIMVSFSSWDGIKMHAQKYLLTDVLKGELGFSGFLVSDWEAINQLHPDLYTAICLSINAGLDMNMVPFRWQEYMQLLEKAVDAGDVSQDRIDDAVRRILQVKLQLGLFEQPFCDVPLEVMGCAEHRALAREAVRKSLVLLKNDGALPAAAHLSALLVAGAHAHDIGRQCGGWTIEWMGGPGAITPGTTILEGLQKLAGEQTEIVYEPEARFGEARAPLGLVVVGEEPYAEGMGDRLDLSLAPAQVETIRRARQHCDKLVVVIISGRPLIVSDWVDEVDGLVAAWLPGSEGDGVAAVLLGQAPFSGKLQYEWPRSMDQIPLGSVAGEPQFRPGQS